MGAASEDPPNNNHQFNPYEGIDADNINYVHSVNYDDMQELLHSLPPGWKRSTPEEIEAGAAPYLHEPSGKKSWKNPNFDKIMSVADQYHQQKSKRKESDDGTSSTKQVKKLRLMLQAGAPLGAVEQKARLEGIDMNLVLSPSDDKMKEDGKALVSDNEDDDAAAIPETLVKKYKRMIKAGVPLDRVQQLAGVEAGASPQQVASILQGDGDGSDKKEESPQMMMNTRMSKFLRMQKAGIPLIAIQNSARLQGYDMDELNEALGVGVMTEDHGETTGKAKKDDVKSDEKAEIKRSCFDTNNKQVKKLRMMLQAGTPLGAVEQKARLEGIDMALVLPPSDNGKEEEKEKPPNEVENGKMEALPSKTSSPYFTIKEGGVAFPSSRVGQNSFPLTDLVRKMAQTVQKTSQFSLDAKTEMVVDELTLFHALGSLQGIQFARDEYNSTVGVTDLETELTHSKRNGFVEMAASIGMTMPNEEVRVDIEGLDDLVEHIVSANQTKLEYARSLLRDGYYDFDSIHTLYPPGSFLIAKHAGGAGADCVCQVVWHRFTQGKTISGKPMKYFQLCVRFVIPVGGGNSTFAEVVEGIAMFEGRRTLSASANGAGLAFVPQTATHDDLLQSFMKRGEVYNSIYQANEQKMLSFKYMAYDKGSFYQKSGGGTFNAGKSSVALASSGRIVVDFDTSNDNGHTISIGRDDMIEGIRMKSKEYKLYLRLMNQSKGGVDSTLGSNSRATVSEGNMILFSQVPSEYLPLVWPTLVGFSLTSKSWGDVVIDGLSEISFDPDVFDSLVITPSRKKMIQALVKHSTGFHDVVEGKGEGTVFLLYGQPGTGKTLTAEAISEFLHRPLYSISMGTLGTTADELERRLSEILHVSQRWDALVLLDEADSFLEARSSHSPLERNAMVSVMLRLVEYHRGILFLTSNRIDSIDPAFQTRITLALRYEQLDFEGRAKVWTNLLLKSNESLASIDVKALAKTELNGREIKNALRLAMALATDDYGDLSQELLLEATSVVNGQKNTLDIDWKKQGKASGWLSSWWR